MALVFAPAHIQRIFLGKQEVSLGQVLCLELVELCRVIEDGGIHLTQLRSRAVSYDVTGSVDATFALPVDEIPIMSGMWFCLHSSAFPL